MTYNTFYRVSPHYSNIGHFLLTLLCLWVLNNDNAWGAKAIKTRIQLKAMMRLKMQCKKVHEIQLQNTICYSCNN